MAISRKRREDLRALADEIAKTADSELCAVNVFGGQTDRDKTLISTTIDFGSVHFPSLANPPMDDGTSVDIRTKGARITYSVEGGRFDLQEVSKTAVPTVEDDCESDWKKKTKTAKETKGGIRSAATFAAKLTGLSAKGEVGVDGEAKGQKNTEWQETDTGSRRKSRFQGFRPDTRTIVVDVGLLADETALSGTVLDAPLTDGHFDDGSEELIIRSKVEIRPGNFVLENGTGVFGKTKGLADVFAQQLAHKLFLGPANQEETRIARPQEPADRDDG